LRNASAFWRPGDVPPWAGQTIVCLASGPSLNPEDCFALRGKVPTIAINDAVRLAPFADVLYSSDRLWWLRERGAPWFMGAKFAVGSRPGAADPVAPDVAVLRYTGVDGLELDPMGLRTGRNSGYAAVNLAVHLGATRIVLLGYDMRPGADGRMHFHGAPRGMTGTPPPLFQVWRRLFLTLVDPLRSIGVSVLNATPGSALDAFPRVTLADVLPGVAA
jgi:hypothetical protein